MWVIDASVVLEVLLKTPLGIRHADRILQANDSLHAPHLIDVEVMQVLRRLTLAGDVDEERAEQVLQNLVDLPIVRQEHVPLLNRIWELRDSATAYDAAYIALAEGLPARLVTCDGQTQSRARTSCADRTAAVTRQLRAANARHRLPRSTDPTDKRRAALTLAIRNPRSASS
jgi:predicted nucleic acid-binding protein